MTNALLLREDRNAVATLTLNNAPSLNALCDGMIEALQTEFDILKEERSIRVIIIKGAGKAFCPGHDLKEMTQARQAEDGGKAYFNDLFKRCSKMMLAIRDLPQPVVAQVHGVAAAAGCQLVASCDMAVAETKTRFGVNGVNVGLFCSTPMVALSRNISRKKTFEMLTSGCFLNAEEALQEGLINRIASAETLDETTRALAETVASKLASAVKIGKQAFYKQAEMSLEDAYIYTGSIMADNMMFKDTQEGIAAFIEKRSPNWEQ